MSFLALLALGALGTADPGYPRSQYVVEARVSEDLATIDGTVDVLAVNDSGDRTSALTVWLYPNVFAAEPGGITEINRNLYQPFNDSLGSLAIGAVLVEGAPALLEPLVLKDAPPGIALRLPLPRSLGPGERIRVQLRFHTTVPHRLGPFSRAHGVLTALGGWFPYLTAGDPDPVDPRERLPAAADYRLRVVVDQRLAALVGGQRVTTGAAVDLRRRSFVDLFVRPVDLRPIVTRGGAVWPIDPRPRQPGGGEVGGLPNPPALESSWPGEELERLLRNLDEWADASPEIPDPGPIDLAVVPLRSEIALATEGNVVVSDRAYAVPSWRIAERYHARAIARAYLARRFLPLAQSRERPADAFQVADALGAFHADRFVTEVMGGIGDLHGVLTTLDFIPGVDEFLRSPRSAFPHVYLQPAAEPIPVRDEPTTFANRAPRGKLLLEKLRDFLGAAGLERALSMYVRPGGPCVSPAPGPGPAPCGLRHAAESVAGRDLGDFFDAWTRRLPAEDVRVFLASTAPAGDEVESRIVAYRIGETPPEVIEVAARDAAGRSFTLVWRAAAGEERKEFAIRSPAPIVALQVDPRRRVAQTPEAPGDSAERGDTVPERLQVLLTYFSASYSAPDQLIYGDVRFAVRERTHLDRRLSFGAGVDRSRLGGFASLGFGLGPLVDAAQYRFNLGIGLTADWLRSGFAGDSTEQGASVGARLGFSYDERPLIPEPRTGSAFGIGGGINAGAGQDGITPYASGAAGALRLFPVGRHQSLAFRIKAAAVGNGAPIQDLIPAGGTDDGLRGFTLEEILAERRAMVSVLWRHTLVNEMDVDLALVRWRGVSGAAFADVAAVGGVRVLPGSGDPEERILGDVGYGLDFRYDFLGVRPLVLGIDVGVPIGRLPADRQLLPPFTVTLRAAPSLSGL